MSKYKNKKVHLDDYVFDSQAEANYYEGLKVRSARGEIQGFERQPVFKLQPAFKKRDKSFQAITYIADFLVYLPNGEVEVVDVKGFITQTFALKKKMFEYKYPHLRLIILSYVQKYGGFIEISELEKLRKAAKRRK
ncbi:DUF1064 domain-containing protein [Bacillus cereus]|uniref:DUF1064 domain-containing protein n=1 Tax=Bacillus cereus TaxID=1396 RepID=UPI000BECA767|nr:DUF1064 domain-containing protein [Bacillus cereus]PEF60296.1 hypothetical protein CON35_31775 [Bacillus cereus]